MRPIIFNKVIILKDVIKSIEDIYIEDDIDYKMKDNDLNCLGKIKISFTVDNGVEKKKIEESIPVECLLSLSKIDCQKDLKLHFKDYQVQVDERILRFALRYELLGNGEKIISFHEIETEEVEEKVLRAINKDFEDKKDDKAINMLKELMQNDGLDIIGAEDLLPLLSKEAGDIDLQEVILKPEEKEEEIIEPLIIIPNAEKVEIKEEKNEIVSNNKEEKSNLGFKEKYVVAFFFYKVIDDLQTYEDIGKKFNIDPKQIRKLNKDEDLYKGKLVKIAK